jgi:hypothetical protein
MRYLAALAVCGLFVTGAAPAGEAGGLKGEYVEARTCDVWTGACFANAEMNLTGRHAVLAWKIEAGREAGLDLGGLSVVAVVEASDTLGLTQTGPARAVVIVDAKATPAQRSALVAVAKRLGGALTANVVAVEARPISIATGGCKEGGCSRVDAGLARIETRCLDHEQDKVCGHEDNFYPPLAAGVTATSAMVTEHSYKGPGFDKTWHDGLRRGAYIGTFSVAK